MRERGVPERAARYDAWFATPLGLALDAAEALAVFELAAPSPGERVLDAGCGTGLYSRRLLERGAVVSGIDADSGHDAVPTRPADTG
jgi:2-polyprenyl-3-methyl-5-hydroxy-6-metoxy-1,4-benzoquinol methylase